MQFGKSSNVPFSLAMLDLGYNDQLGGFVPSEIGMLTSLSKFRYGV